MVFFLLISEADVARRNLAGDFVSDEFEYAEGGEGGGDAGRNLAGDSLPVGEY